MVCPKDGRARFSGNFAVPPAAAACIQNSFAGKFAQLESGLCFERRAVFVIVRDFVPVPLEAEAGEVLLLDEATSSVDSELEERIEIATDELLDGRTSLVIAHRLSTVRHADKIYVLKRGELAEQGTHEALIAEDGVYARLWRVQTGLAVGA